MGRLKKYANFLFALSASVLFTFGTNPYRFGISDHSFILPILHKLSHPALFANDFVVDLAPYYASVFWVFVQKVITLSGMPEPALFFLLYAGFLLGVFYGISAISYALFKSHWAVFFTLAALLYFQTGFGGFELIGNQLLNRLGALPLGLWALWLAFSKKYLPGSFLLAVAFLFHPITGLYFWVFFTGGYLYKHRFTDLKQLVVSQLPFFIVAFGFTFSKKFFGENPLDSFPFWAPDDWYTLLRLRSAHHLFPDTWAVENTIYQSVIMLGGLALLFSNSALRARKFLIGGYISVILLLLFNFIFTLVFPVSIVLQLSLMRSSILPMLLSFIIIIGSIMWYADRQKYGVSGGLLLLIFPLIKNSNQFGMIWPQAFLLIFFALLLYILGKKYRSGWPAVIGVGLVVMLSLFEAVTIRNTLGSASIADFQDARWKEVQLFARDNADIGALFIVPPSTGGFRVESNRSSYGDYKDGALIFYNYEFSKEWLRRMRVLRVEFGEGWDIISHYDELTTHDFYAIKQEQGARYREYYVITKNGHKLEKLPLLFENELFNLYRLN